MKKFFLKYQTYIVSVAISLGVGALSAAIVGSASDSYAQINSPPLSPPPWVFPVVWTILYILMGVSAAIIWESKSETKNHALTVYASQLIVNFFWPIIYFLFEKRGFALLWLLLLIYLVVYMTTKFNEISKSASRLNYPYILWLIFAFYLNFGTYLLNK